MNTLFRFLALVFALGFLFGWGITPASAIGDDVCCIMSSEDGDTVSTAATFKTQEECTSGNTVASGVGTAMKACAVFSEEECSTATPEIRCLKCGYFWSGKVCFVEDPVKKAKEALQKEAAEKKEKEGEDSKQQGEILTD